MRGYDPAEVDEFLDKVAECIQVYVQRTKDYERIMEEQAERLSDYDNIKGSLHEALLMAQRTSEEKLRNATRLADETLNNANQASEDKLASAARAADERINQANLNAESILADARIKAEQIIRDAEAAVSHYGHEVQSLQELRNSGFTNLKSFLSEVSTVIERAEAGGRIQMPSNAFTIMNRFDASTPTSSSSAVVESEAKRQEISETLSMLGIDPSLLNINAEIN
jgi:cell division initiation protein